MPKPLVALSVTALLIAVAGCGSSSHRHAHAVLDRAEAAFTEIHALYAEAHTELVREREAWPERCPIPDLPSVLGLPREQRHAMGAINRAEARYYRCLGQINVPDGFLRESGSDVARYNVESLRTAIERLRTELDETPAEVLDPIVQQASSDEAIWNDLYLLSNPGAMAAVMFRGSGAIPGIDIDAARERIAERAERARTARAAVDDALEQLAADVAEARILLDQ